MPYSAEDKKEIAKYQEELKQEWNRSMIAHIRKVNAIPKPSVQFPKTIEKACETYFDLCEEDGVKPSVAGLSVALGTSEDILLQWVRGEVSIESSDIIKKYFSFLQVFDETALKDNQTNAVGQIFMGKQHYGYKDVVEHKIIDDREISNEEIEMRYRKIHEIVSEQTPQEIEEKPKSYVGKKKKSTLVVDDEVPF